MECGQYFEASFRGKVEVVDRCHVSLIILRFKNKEVVGDFLLAIFGNIRLPHPNKR